MDAPAVHSRDPEASGPLLVSSDGIHWDEGRILRHRGPGPGGGDAYSANEVIGKYDASVPNRLLIQSSIAYEADNPKVNEAPLVGRRHRRHLMVARPPS